MARGVARKDQTPKQWVRYNMDWSDSNDTTKGSVTRMSDIQTRIRFAPLAQIESYWNSLRGTRLMPQRSEIDPRGLKGGR